MKFLRAEEGDEPAPATIHPFIQIVPASDAPKNRHKRPPAHAAQAHAAPSVPAAPPAAAAPVEAARGEPTPAKPAHAKPGPAKSAAHATPTRAVTIHAPKAHVAKARAASPMHQLREVTPVHPTPPRIRPEMLDACVVALRRMGGPGLQSVGVTSSVRGEGRSTVAAAMAVIHASEFRHRTILVEFDGHEPPAARAFGIAESPGVAEFIRGDVDIEDCIQWVTEDLGVVVAGADPSMATLLRGSTAEDIVEAVWKHGDTLVLDLPPLEKGAGGVQLVDLCEAVALVVRAGVSTHRIEEAAAALTTPPFVILNGTKSATPRWVRRLLGMR
jgi:Mrp family chromosome partitioning ATPase